MLSFQRLLSTEKNREEFDTESDADKHSESELQQDTDQGCDEAHCGSQSLDTSADVVDDMDDDEDAEEGEILEDGELVDDDEAQKGETDSKTADDDEKQKKDDKGDKKRERRPSVTSRAKEMEKKRRKRRRRESDDDENDGDTLRAKRRARDERRSPLRATSPDSISEASESNDDDSDISFSEEMMLQMFKQMMEKMKKESGESKKKSKMEKIMEKMMRNQSNLGSREVREMFLRNKRLFRTGNLERERGERNTARVVRERERRLALRQGERRVVRERERERERGVRERESAPRDRDRERVREREKDRERQRVDQPPKSNTCKFFLEGKCHRGAECPFPHDAPQQKKKDICKFYLQGYCGKGEHCLFMHGEFPCKFFHTGAECYSGDKCRFSHQPLTEETRSILKAYLDSGELPDEQQSQASGTNSSSSFPYQPVKPVQKRHAVLGDVTEEMKTSYWTWIWQQEMKELELAYTGNKRNLFCIEKPFVVSEKPSTPEPIREGDYDEREQTKVMSFYIDTMADVNNAIPAIPDVNEDDKLLELSYHDEDLRLPLVPTPTAPPNVMEGVNNSHAIVKTEIMEPEDMPCEQSVQNFVTNSPPVIPEESLPKTARDLFERIRSKNNQKQGLQSEDSEGDTTGDLIISSQDADLREKEVKEEKKWLSESEEDEDDDDTEDQPLKAALKKLQNQQQHQPKEEASKQQPKIDIAKMLSVIRQTTTQMSGASISQTAVKQADFWQTIFSGCSNVQSAAAQSESRDPRLTGTPPQNEPRDPRLKRSKAEGKSVSEVSSSPTSTSESSKTDIKSVECEFKLLPVTVNDIDYSCYVALYRSDVKLKNDPRLQKFFSKLPNSVIDHLSKILPPPAHQSPVSSTSTLQTVTSSSPTKRSKRGSVSPPKILPPLPPLTLTQPKSTLMSSIVPPPPPLMSPFELTTSKPSFAVPNPLVKQENSHDEEKLEQKPQVLQMPSPLLSSSTSDSKPIAAHLPQGLTSLVSLVTSKTTTSDLRKNLIKKTTASSEQSVTSMPEDSNNTEEQSEEIADRPLSPTEEFLSVASPSSEVLTIAEDTPQSPTSRRSSSEIGSPPSQPSTIVNPLSPPKEESLVIVEPNDETRESIKDVFKTIDPTASPFC